jgi:hypothetical protein
VKPGIIRVTPLRYAEPKRALRAVLWRRGRTTAVRRTVQRKRARTRIVRLRIVKRAGRLRIVRLRIVRLRIVKLRAGHKMSGIYIIRQRRRGRMHRDRILARQARRPIAKVLPRMSTIKGVKA